jgi:hypothetical protein
VTDRLCARCGWPPALDGYCRCRGCFWALADSYEPDFDCLDCGRDTLALGDYYMLRDPVWLEANPDDEGMLCLWCVQVRLGRLLRQGDFSLAPVNFKPRIFKRWARLAA